MSDYATVMECLDRAADLARQALDEVAEAQAVLLTLAPVEDVQPPVVGGVEYPPTYVPGYRPEYAGAYGAAPLGWGGFGG